MGVIAINVIRELTKMGVDVSLHTLNPKDDPVKPHEFPPEVQQALKKGFREDVINIFFSYPDIFPVVRCKVNVGYTGADTTGWYLTGNARTPTESCNEFMDYMLTPSDFSRKIMQDCGVKIPIELYPHGVNLDLFKPIKRDPSMPFTLVYAGELTKRKGAQDLINAYINAVGADCDAFQLLLRANTHMMYLESEEIRELASQSRNIHIHWKNEGQEDLVNYLNQGHIFVYPSRADWYGMIPFEAMATGMPVIATATNGYYEFLKDKIIPVSYKLSDIGDQHPYFKGQWSDPDPLFLRLAITGTINDYKQYAEKAYDDAFKIREEFSWKAVTEKYLMPFLEKVDKKHFTSTNRRIEMLKRIPKLSDRVK